MKQFVDDHRLKNMTVPTVRPSHHYAALRRVLVFRAANNTRSNLTVQGVVRTMTKRNIFVGASVTAMLAIAVVTFAIATPTNVSALQIAQNSSKALANMTPGEAEYAKFYPYFVDWVKQAQKAPDLRLLSYDEVVNAYPAEMGVKPGASYEPLRVIDDPSDNAAPDIHQLRYLEFTATYDDSTYKVAVGVNANNIPEAALMHFISGQAPPKIGG